MNVPIEIKAILDRIFISKRIMTHLLRTVDQYYDVSIDIEDSFLTDCILSIGIVTNESVIRALNWKYND